MPLPQLGSRTMSSPVPAPAVPLPVKRASLLELVRYFLYLGTFGFGGPVALVGFMHRDLVERRGWIDEDRLIGETLTAIRRAGADLILTYFAEQAAQLCRQGKA